MAHLFADTGIWVLLSFVIFAVFAFRMGKDKFLAKLDGRIAEIRTDIQMAETLRAEAQDLLAQYQAKQRDAAQEAKSIVTAAQNAADEINKQAQADLDEMMVRKEAQLAERLKRMEEAAKAEIQAYAAELAVKATAEIIASQLDAETNSRLVDATIKSVPGNLSKAA